MDPDWRAAKDPRLHAPPPATDAQESLYHLPNNTETSYAPGGDYPPAAAASLALIDHRRTPDYNCSLPEFSTAVNGGGAKHELSEHTVDYNHGSAAVVSPLLGDDVTNSSPYAASGPVISRTPPYPSPAASISPPVENYAAVH